MWKELQRKIMMMVGRCVIEAVNDSGPLQKNQVTILSGEVKDGYDRVQEYGFTSVPKSQAEGIVICIGGNRDHGVVIATDDRRYRPKNLKAGEVVIYNDKGDMIKFKDDSTIEITAGTKIRMVTPLLEVTGDIIDNVGSNSSNMEDMRTIYNGHTHTGDSGGTTGAPSASM